LAHPLREKLGSDERDLFRAQMLRERTSLIPKPDPQALLGRREPESPE